ncbi:MAG: tetratricopeptide repeat protein [Bacteroidia bacterium]
MARQKVKALTPLIKPFELFPFTKSWMPYAILAIIGFAFYINTVQNEFALDDGIAIHQNSYVMEGVSGIGKIMTKDAYDSFYKNMNAQAQLSGGRYRPLSLVTFAIEQEFIGKFPEGKIPQNSWDLNGNHKTDVEEDINQDGLWNINDTYAKGASMRHFNNVWLYILAILLIYSLFKNHMFTQYPDLAFLAALFFCIHPVHTEVVANTKSRDEILSILFIALTFINIFRYKETKQIKYVGWTMVNCFLALLSKEYAVTLIAVIPVTLFLFDKEFSLKKYGFMLAAVGFAFFIYFSLRFSSTVIKSPVPDKEVLNNPYLFAKPTQKVATIIFVWLKYLVLLFFPAVLSSDYSFNSIPYRNLTSIETIASFFIYVGLVVLAFNLVRKKHPAAWGLLFFFSNFLMICNLLFPIGATMGERLIFHSSLGWAVCIAWLFTETGKKYFTSVKVHRAVLISATVIITCLFGWRTITRNMDWKNDITLFALSDVKTMPNSVLCLGNAGARYIDLAERPANKAQEKELLNKAKSYLTYSLTLHPKYVNGYLNLGYAEFKLHDFNKAEEIWMKAYQLYPSEPHLTQYFSALGSVYVQQAFADARENKLGNSQYWFQRATKICPNDSQLWYNLGGVSYTLKDYAKAKEAFTRCLQIDPNNQQAKNGLAGCPA